jgi:hypothetical protein
MVDALDILTIFGISACDLYLAVLFFRLKRQEERSMGYFCLVISGVYAVLGIMFYKHE